MKPHIDLHIDRLVLHGFEHLDRATLGAAVEAELTRLFAEHGTSATLHEGSRIPRIDGGSFSAAPGATAGTLGVQIARSVYGGMNRE